MDVHCTQQKTGLVHSRSECWMRLVPMPLPSSTNAFQTQTMLSRLLVLSNGSDGHTLTMPSLKDSRGSRDSSQEQATSSILVMTGLRHNQRHHNMWTRCSTTHTMMKHPQWFVDGNKWCDNKVETRDVHCALIPLHGSQRTTQIVASVSKVAWTRITRTPCNHTHNHAWRVANHISLHVQHTLVQVWQENDSG